MAFPQVASVTESEFTNGSSTRPVDMPATCNTGDLLLCLYTNGDSRTVTTPSGWELLYTQTNGAWRSSAFARVSDGTEGGTTVNFNLSGNSDASAQVYRITGFAGTVATDIDVGTAATGANATPDAPSVTAGWGSDDNLFIINVGIGTGGSLPGAETVANYTDQVNTGASSGANTSIVTSWRREYASASDNPAASSNFGIGMTWVANTIVIKPGLASQTVSPSSIASTEAIGTIALIQGLSGVGNIASEEAFGTATMRMNVTAEAIASAEAVGEPTVSPIQAVSPSGIVTEEALGTPAVTPDTYTITPDGIDSAEAIGEAVIGRAAFPSSISSLEAFGTAHIKKYITFDGIASAEAIGSHQLNRSLILTGIASAEAFGATVITVGSVTITVSGIGTEEDFPEPLIIAATTSGFRRPPPGSARYIPVPSAGSAKYAARPPAGV